MHHRSLLWLFLLLGACENQSPSTPGIAIKPAAPSTTDDLELVFDEDITDPEGDKLEQSVSWLKEGIVQWDLEGLTTVPASQTAKGENWEVLVVATDGLSDPATARTGTTIQNSAPRLDTVSISPEEPTGDSTLQAEAVFVDEDGDNVSLTYVWKRTPEGGAEETTEYTDSFVPGDATAKNETWKVEVTPFDGEDAGEVGSATVVIANAIPEILSISFSPDPVYTLTNLVASVSTLDADGDTVSVTYKWTVNGNPKNDPDDTLDHDQFVKGDEVALTVTAYDGFQDGDVVTSDTMTIQNSLPTLTGVSIMSDESDAYETSVLSCSPVGWNDDDGDAEEYGHTWTVNGSALNAPGETITGDHFNKHDIVFCTIWPMNQTETGVEWTSTDWEIQNTPPDLTDVTLDNTTPTENDTVTPVITVTDADGDSLTHTVTWYDSIGGGILVTAGTIDGTWFDRGDEFYAIISSNDGEEDSLQTLGSDTATVANAPPMVTSVTLNGTSFGVGQDMTATAAGSDADGDSVTVSTITWFVNGSSANSVDSALLTPADIGGTKGDSIHVEATLADLYGGVSSPMASTTVTVIDTTPSINNQSITGTEVDSSGNPRSDTDLSCGFWLVESDLGDTPSAHVEWASSGTVYFSETLTRPPGTESAEHTSTLTASSHSLIKGAPISCSVTPVSAGATGTTATTTITLGNALPVISGLTLTPDPPGTDDILSLNVTSAFDRDGDPVTLGYVWSVNGTAISAATTSTLDGSSYFSKGQPVMVVTTPNDGLESGFPQTMSRTVANSPPVDLEIGLSPSEPVNQENDVVCSITNPAYDPDGDPIDYEFSWRIDESVNGGAWRDFGDVYGDATFQTNYLEDSVEASEVFEGETLECTVTATDDEGLALTVSDQVTPIPEPCGSGAASWNSATDSYVELDGGSSDGGLDFGDFTVEAWVSPVQQGTALLGMPFIGAYDSTAAFWQIGWLVSSGTSHFGAMLSDATSTFFLSADDAYWPDNNSWHHVALSGEGESNGSLTYRLFVDGRLVDTTNRNDAPSAITNPIRIGKMDGISDAWPGKVDDVRISSAAIYTQDFQPEMRLPDDADTLALYHLDDSGSSTATDTTGSGVYGNGTANQVGGVSWSIESVCDVAGDIAKISMGTEAGCWLTIDGEIDCWGLNRYPNYGSGNPALGNVEGHPTGSGYQDVAISYYHACAVDQSGCIECWGDYQGQYRSGDNNGGGGTNAQPTAAECEYQSVVVGENHNCGLKVDGTVHCWGWDNPYGLISAAPTTMTFSKLSAWNYVTCGLQDNNGGLFCWGYSGDLMDTSLDSPSFGLSDFEICDTAACGIKESDGQVVCWGEDVWYWNRTGRFLADYNSDGIDDTVGFPTIYGASAVAMGQSSGCAANGTGQVECWGNPGNSMNDPVTTTPPPGNYRDLDGGYTNYCGITSYGRVECWGVDGWGETNPPIH